MKTPSLISKEESQLVRDYLIIPVMLDYIESDISVIQDSGLKTDLILIRSLKKVQEDIRNEMFGIRLSMGKLDIKVYENRRSKLGIDAQYVCRGYHHRMSLLWSTIRTEVLLKASRYTGVGAGSATVRGKERV